MVKVCLFLYFKSDFKKKIEFFLNFLNFNFFSYFKLF
jgi:hypothetical protein